MEEQMKAMEQRQETMEAEMRTQFTTMGNQFSTIEAHLAEFVNMMKMQPRINEQPPRLGQNRVEPVRHEQPRTLGYVPKIEFPVFDGMNARNWVKRNLGSLAI
ncbi:hypothetical protein L2E82_49271 [Cichorium intybus]|uniref:Uncharacterized protein n=1 Tax=Cichorium intybus TaxID=13427 RepID=A0ACB8YZ88_CICIN|nr:hypothetical protein L2E82_49271 [Cichorium intybus]